MPRILAIGGSNNPKSINYILVKGAASFLKKSEAEIVTLLDFPAPLFSVTDEQKDGSPSSVLKLKQMINDSDGIILSVPEYNSSVPSPFKSMVDWLSKLDGKIFGNKPLLLMSASPGRRGGASVLAHLSELMPFWGADVRGTFSMPLFKDNVGSDGEILNQEKLSELKKLVSEFEDVL
jgi:chromate reductase, NAD(P)H dehydrogenase (quinone)